jgi:hypothetical protein
MRRTRFAVCVLMFLLAALGAEARTGGGAQRRRARQAEQTTFNAEGTVRRPVALPQSVLGILARDERVRACYSHEDEGAFAIRDWFVAASVRLGGAAGRAGYVVLPKGGCLFGANIIPFWVFAPEGRGHRLVLKTHALTLTVGRKRTRGLRNIDISAASAVQVFEAGFEFDGTRYVPRWCRRTATAEELKSGRGKLIYYTCGDAEKPY